MSLSLFIARKLYQNTDGGKRVSRPAVLIAMIGIAIGLIVMIITVAVVVGFKKEIRSKVTGFGSDIQITNLDAIRSYETHPIQINDSIAHSLYQYPELKHVQRYSTKPGIIKTDDAFQGVVLKGIGQEYNRDFYTSHLLEGIIPNFTDSTSTNQVVISKSIADKLKLKVGDKIFTYFIQDNVRVRPLVVKGIYQTNFSEYDNLFVLTDIYTVGRLNNWQKDQVSGVEIKLKDYALLEDVTYQLAEDLDRKEDAYGGVYYVENIEELNPQIFEWLKLLDLNVWVILILMIGVAGFTMISGLLIIIIERTNMIGILKALGANNFTIRKVFLWFAVFLIGKGMLWGNAIGLCFYFIQHYFHIFKLDPASYYIDSVPVSLNLFYFLLINISTLIVSVLMLIGPSYLITKINPATSMRYE